MRHALAVVSLLLLVGCGGGSSSPTPVTPTPAPTPVPTFSGSYSGPMIENLAGQAEVRGTGSTRLTQNGSTIDFTPLVVVIPGLTTQSYQLGTAATTGNSFGGTSAYQSNGCDRVDVAWTGRFAGNLMNLTVILTPIGRGSACGRFEFRGELSK